MITTKFKINDNVCFYETNAKKILICKVVGIQIFVSSEPERLPTTDGTKGLIETGNFKPKNVEVSYRLTLPEQSPSIFDIKMIKEEDLYSSIEELKAKITEAIQQL
jgi:hypothetical protein